MSKSTIERLAYDVADEVSDLIVAHSADSSPFKGSNVNDAKDRLSEAVVKLICEAIYLAKNND